MRLALIETTTGKVVNVIELEPGAEWQPPVGHFTREAGAWRRLGWSAVQSSSGATATTSRAPNS